MATRETYIVSGVCCSTEEAVLRRSLNNGLGKDQYRYNPTTCELQVLREVAPGRVLEQVRRAGFEARRSSTVAEDRSFWARHNAAVMAGAAALLTIAGIILEYQGVPPVISGGLFAAAMTVGGWRIAIKALKALRAATLDMNVLMTVAVIGAMAINRWAEGATVIVLFSVALMLESYSVSRTRRAIRSMLQLCPEQATVVTAHGERIVAAREVTPGTSVRIRPGERIPVDGEVTGGESSVSEAPITGEADPVEKTPGDRVFAGSINAGGTLLVRATHAFEQTTLARIVHLIEEAHRARAPVQRAVDRFARVYTPVVMGLALVVALLPPVVLGGNAEEWVYRGLVLLVIACPCALVISTPVSIVSALTAAARRGILVKGGIHLETLARIRAIAFDKTGTLTEGKPRLTDIIPLEAISQTELLRYAAALEKHSEHTLARAVLREAALRELSYGDLAPEGFEATPGQGVRAWINGAKVQVASPRALDSLPALSEDRTRSTLDRLAQEGKTTLVVVQDDRVLGVLAARDTVRQWSRAVVEDLHGLGIRDTVLLSGDRPASTARAAQETAVHRFQGELLPQEKLEAVEELKRRHQAVAMVGDGVNDAPALAAASVGIAMGGSGTDSAMETADVVLMGDAIERLPELLRLSRTTMAIIGQNIALALVLKLVFLVLSVVGEATLWMAVLADDGAALLVILNGLRLLRYASGKAVS